ncbi:MAG: phage/plasmid primase, P4 family [Tepidisphaeraceae bacterium]
MSQIDFQKLLDSYQSNCWPAMVAELAKELGVSPASLNAQGVGFAPVVPTKKGKNFKGHWTFAERDSNGTVVGLSLRGRDGFKMMYPGSEHGLFYILNPERERAGGGYHAGPQNWTRVGDAGVPCAVCGKPDGCVHSSEDPTDPKAVLCIRVRQGSVKTISKGSLPSYLHIRKAAGRISCAGVSPLADNSGPVLIVEGASDCLAAFDLGFDAVGRPSNLACLPELCDLIRGREVIIVGENDRKWSEAAQKYLEPGRDGMTAAFQAVRGAAKSASMLMPPSQWKDFRGWKVNANLTREQFLTYATSHKKAEPVASDQPTPEQVASFCSDIGNAKRMVRRHGDKLRYSPASGQYLAWSGVRWEPDEVGKATGLAKEMVLSILAEAREATDDLARTNLAKWALHSQRRERVNAALALAQDELAVIAAQLDADPFLFNVLNGTLDLRTGTLRPHRREDLISKLAPVTYDREAKCPLFNAFLARIFKTQPGLINYMQAVMGYSMTGKVTEQVLFFPYGVGGNGKSVLLDLMLFIFGSYGTKAAQDLLMSKDGQTHPADVADLMGKRLVIASETKVGQRFDDGKLKSLIGEQIIKARFMRQNFFSFDATFKLFLLSNNKPAVRGTDHGFWRRIRLIPFLEVIDESEKDPELLDKLKAEASGILNWLVAGALHWHREGLPIPPEVSDATRSYREENDTIGRFLDESCLAAANAVTPAGMIYDAYRRWCQESGEYAESQTRLGLTLGNRGFAKARDSKTGRYLWRGLSLRDSVGSRDGRSRVTYG